MFSSLRWDHRNQAYRDAQYTCSLQLFSMAKFHQKMKLKNEKLKTWKWNGFGEFQSPEMREEKLVKSSNFYT